MIHLLMDNTFAHTPLTKPLELEVQGAEKHVKGLPQNPIINIQPAGNFERKTTPFLVKVGCS